MRLHAPGILKPKAKALIRAWTAWAEAAGFSGLELRAAAGLTITVASAYLVAGVLALIGHETADSSVRVLADTTLGSVEVLDQYYVQAGGSGDWEIERLTVVPPLFLDRFPEDYGGISDATEYKARFVQIVLPLVLAENRRVRRQRASLAAILAQTRSGAELRPSQQIYLRDLAGLYRTTENDIEGLIGRVDAVPASLALAQAAVESSWGRSRFARLGNALFGQWTLDEAAGLVPLGRPEGEAYLVRKFPGLRASVRAYLVNLNSHPAYEDFRRRRAVMRENGEPLYGYDLALELREYSQKGVDYTASLRSIIRVNHLVQYDRARLGP